MLPISCHTDLKIFQKFQIHPACLNLFCILILLAIRLFFLLLPLLTLFLLQQNFTQHCFFSNKIFKFLIALSNSNILKSSLSISMCCCSPIILFLSSLFCINTKFNTSLLNSLIAMRRFSFISFVDQYVNSQEHRICTQLEKGIG